MAAVMRRDAPLSLDVNSFRKAISGIDDYNILIHQAAKWYAENGFKIVPFRPGNKDGKYSGYPKGLSQKHASCNPQVIDEWWHPTEGKYPGASIAMAHGGQSGFCAIDLDNKADIDGIKNLADLQAAYGDYNDGEGEGLSTLMAYTPSGGRHLIFRYHPEIITNSEFSYPGIDTRGGLKKNPIENGGITFVEPSRKPKTEGCYKWDDSITDIIDIPQWLVDVLNNRIPQNRKGIKLQDVYIQSAPGLHGDGRDRNIYMDLMRFAGIGYTEEQLWGLLPEIVSRMDPPDEDMVRRKIESVIESDAFAKAKEDQKTAKQIASLDLIEGEKGPIKCVENLERILSSPLFEYEYGLIEFDDFTKNFILDKKQLASVVDWSIGIQSWIARKFRMDFPKTDIRDKVEYLAYSKDHTNLAKEYMLSCPRPDHNSQKDNFWGSGRKGPGPAFKRLCYEVLDLGNKNLHPNYTEELREAYEGFLWFWLQGVVARACVPGCKMEIVLNIFGSQGIGKSLFFSELCPDPTWFTDSLQDSIVSGSRDNRDELLKIHSKIIVEMPELSPVKRGGKSADDKLKQFISTRVDNLRKPYGTDSVDWARSCALAGTSNNRDVYRDSTGARRFVSIDHGSVPIRVGDQNNGIIDAIRDQLWGELTNSFNFGELESSPNRLLVAIPPDLRHLQSLINDSHRFEEVGINDVIEWMQDKTRVTWSEIVTQAKTIPGLRDAKESHIMTLVRSVLSNNQNFEFRKKATRYEQNGDKHRTNCWINTAHPDEIDWDASKQVPPHWSKSEEQPEPEY